MVPMQLVRSFTHTFNKRRQESRLPSGDGRNAAFVESFQSRVPEIKEVAIVFSFTALGHADRYLPKQQEPLSQHVASEGVEA